MSHLLTGHWALAWDELGFGFGVHAHVHMSDAADIHWLHVAV